MDIQLTSGLVLLGCAVPIAGGLAWYGWENRALPGVLPFLFLVPLGAIWALAQAWGMVTPGLTGKIVLTNIKYIGVCFLPVAAFVMALDYSGHRYLLTKRHLVVLCVVPVVTLILLCTNAYHHLARTSYWLDAGRSISVLRYTYGPWQYVHMIYSYSLVLAAFAVLVAAVISAPSLYRRQPVAMVLGTTVPLACHALSVLVPSILPGFDFTPVGLMVAGVVIVWGLIGIRLFNLVPVARSALVEKLDDGVLVLDRSDHVVDLNESARALIGHPVISILSRPLAESWPAWNDVAAPYAAGANQAELHLGSNGGRRHFEVKWSPLLRKREVMGRLVVLRDVTERVIMEDNLRRQALTDGLTGLPNRALFMARLDDAIHQARRHAELLFAVMVLDLDRFKLINDSIGHLAGDVLLQSVATKLKHCVREADTVARMGGDEFMILVHHIAGPRDLLPILERIQEELRTPVYFRQQEMTTASSVGVVIWNPSYDDGEDVLRAADTAMYQAKEAGRGCHRIFDEEMHKAVLRTLKAETDLRAAIRQRDFSMSYQPVADLKTGRIRSLEALLRWRHPQRGTVFPHEFIGIAENGGLTMELGNMALDEVCSQVSRWQTSHNPAGDLTVSINISPRQLTEPDFLATVAGRLNAWHVPADSLTFEITENALQRDPVRSKQVMSDLRGMGIRLCLDDFGSGSSSLQHLTTYPVEELKIDPSFVSRIAPGGTDLEVVRSLTALAHTLGLRVTGEGVEHSEQWRLLEGLGCDCAQGYFVGRPMDAQELPLYLSDLERGSCALRPAQEELRQPGAGRSAVPVRQPGTSILYPYLSLAEE